MTVFPNTLQTNMWEREGRLYISSSSDGGDREAGAVQPIAAVGCKQQSTDFGCKQTEFTSRSISQQITYPL